MNANRGGNSKCEKNVAKPLRLPPTKSGPLAARSIKPGKVKKWSLF
jgi:hypothetical protein